MTNSMPEGFGLKDKVTFDQLPEQIQEYYVGPKYGTEESLWLKETHAVLMFLPQPPNAPWVDYWEKTADDNWVNAAQTGIRNGKMPKMQCPQCQAKVRFPQMSKHQCPKCGAKIYLSDKWRWLRGLACGLITILLHYRWYPLEGSFALHVTWGAVILLTFLVLLLVSVYVLPPEVDLVPGGWTCSSGSLEIQAHESTVRAFSASALAIRGSVAYVRGDVVVVPAGGWFLGLGFFAMLRMGFDRVRRGCSIFPSMRITPCLQQFHVPPREHTQ